jgi:hypothetical protein
MLLNGVSIDENLAKSCGGKSYGGELEFFRKPGDLGWWEKVRDSELENLLTLIIVILA